MTISWHEWIGGSDPDGSQPPEDWPFHDQANALAERLGHDWRHPEFDPTPEDKQAASAFYVQLVSRITTRRLHYLDGDERAALTSVYQLFQFARDTCTQYEPKCNRFTDLVWSLLNEVVSHFTAKWHKVFESQDDRLSEDQRHAFREELEPLQDQLSYYLQLFRALSRGGPILSPPPESRPSREPHQPFEFTRILFSPNVDDATAEAVYRAERDEIQRRRGSSDADKNPEDLTGLALSGGGLRSATFALGAIHGLAKNGVLPNFDYLSTVSGGGYAGSFLSCFLNTDVTTTPPIGLGSDELPFARYAAQESAPMRHLRSSSKTLITGGFWRQFQIPFLALAGWLASLLVALPPIILLTALICFTNAGAIQRALNIAASGVSEQNASEEKNTNAKNAEKQTPGDNNQEPAEKDSSTQDQITKTELPPIYTSKSPKVWLVGGAGLLFLAGLGLLLWAQQEQRDSGKTSLPEKQIYWVVILGFLFVGLLGWLLFPYAMILRHQIKVLVGSFPVPGEGLTAAIGGGGGSGLYPTFAGILQNELDAFGIQTDRIRPGAVFVHRSGSRLDCKALAFSPSRQLIGLRLVVDRDAGSDRHRFVGSSAVEHQRVFAAPVLSRPIVTCVPSANAPGRHN